MRAKSTLCLLPLLVSACQSAPERPADFTDCPASRPQICTMIYAPVCAMDKEGKLKTYPSDCSACSDKEVVAYQPGEC